MLPGGRHRLEPVPEQRQDDRCPTPSPELAHTPGLSLSLAARVPAERLALIAALTTVALWASAFVGIRAASVDLTAGPLALGRLLVGSLALGVLVLARGVVRPSRRDFLFIVASGLLWFAFYNVALNEAERNRAGGGRLAAVARVSRVPPVTARSGAAPRGRAGPDGPDARRR